MRHIKKLGLVVVAAVAAMALVGASSAMAEGTTALCKVNTDPCPAASRYPAGTVLEGVASNPTLLGKFFGITGTITCEKSVVAGTLNSAVGTPLTGTITTISFTGNCKDSFGDSCPVSTVKTGTLDLLRTGPNVGTATSLGNEILVKCSGFINMDCVFAGTPQLKAEGSPAKELTASAAVLTGSGSGCPENPRWDALYKLVKPTTDVFITH
jgi:hypothetical protein